MTDFTEIREALAKLTACPFCGASPHHGLGKVEHCQLHGDPFQRFSVWCPRGHAKVTAMNREAAIAEWNTRALPPALLADRDQWKERAEKAEAAFLETREMLGIVEDVICEECCPTTWRTVDGQPHCKLHEDIKAVLARHEAVRDIARAALEASHD